MYAIVRTGGKQYRVERGQRLLVERLAAKEGAEVSLEPLLYRSEEAVLDKAGLDAAFEKHRQAYVKIFGRCGLRTIQVEAHSGAMGGSGSTE